MCQSIFRNQFYSGGFCCDPNAQRRRRNKPGLAGRLIAVYAGFLLIGSTAFAANDVSGEPPPIPAAQADAELEALLLQVEQQISTGHALSPPDDNALNTWPRVVRTAVPTSPGARRALEDFISRVGSRAAEERGAERTDVWIDLILFKDLATSMLVTAGAAPAASSNSQTTTSQAMSEGQAAPGPPVTEAAGMANSIDTPSGAATKPSPSPTLSDLTRTSAGPTPRSLGNPADSPASPAMDAAKMNAGQPAPSASALAIAIPAPRTPTAEQRSLAAIYASRGDEMLSIKDISAARKYYEYAANAGSARAATALAESYDPAFLTQLGAVGIRPDPALAAAWYGRAVALGDAETRLRTQSRQIGP
jgi:hypothetical protein